MQFLLLVCGAIAGIVVVCFTAYKIKAESFEVSAAIWKLISFSIKIKSPDRRGKDKDEPTEP